MNMIKKFNEMLSLKFLLTSMPLLVLDVLYLFVRFALEWEVTFSMILYLISNSLENVPIDSFRYYVGKQLIVLGLSIVGYIVISFVIYVLKHKMKYITQCYFQIVCYVFLIVSICLGLHKLGFTEYVMNKYIESSYIADNFVNIDMNSIIVPDKKRNLIVLMLESMEQSYASTIDGGILPENFIPNLSNLVKENVAFDTLDSHGFTQMFSDFTFASIVATSSGLPFKGALDSRIVALGGTESNKNIFPEVNTIGTILNDIGYNNYAIMGSNSEFSGKGDYFRNHGSYEIYDYIKAKEECYIPSNYGVRWGLEDKKVFDWSKILLTEISQMEEPFHVIIETSDVHFPDGYICENCNNEYGNTILDVIKCNDKQIMDFISWVKLQSWYKDTVIVLLGDHLYMGSDCFELYGKEGLSDRTIYNCFLNVDIPFDKNVFENRKYTMMDMAPTILSSLGIELSNHSMGLGVNLFSGVETIVERDGYEFVYDELAKHSIFYDNIYK